MAVVVRMVVLVVTLIVITVIVVLSLYTKNVSMNSSANLLGGRRSGRGLFVCRLLNVPATC